MVDVHAARIPDRDRLVEALRGAGLDAQPSGELDIEVHRGGDADVFAEVESLVLDLGATMIPIKHDGVIYLRPPVG
ncbi:MAG: hypothetical protein ABUS54_04755 [Actinomycetota bacterium]